MTLYLKAFSEKEINQDKLEWVQREAIKMIKRKEPQSDKKRYRAANMFSLKKKRVEHAMTHFQVQDICYPEEAQHLFFNIPEGRA